MTRQELIRDFKRIEKTAYLRFPEPVNTPYILIGLPGNDDTNADNTHHFRIQEGWAELYMTQMDFELMQKVEEVFITNGMPWSKENEAYIEDGQIFYARWHFQLF